MNNPWDIGGKYYRDWSKPQNWGGKKFWHLYSNTYFQAMSEEELEQWQKEQFETQMALLLLVAAPMMAAEAAGGTGTTAAVGGEAAVEAGQVSSVAAGTTTAAGSAEAASLVAASTFSGLQKSPSQPESQALESLSKNGLEGLNEFFHEQYPYNSQNVYGPPANTGGGKKQKEILNGTLRHRQWRKWQKR